MKALQGLLVRQSYFLHMDGDFGLQTTAAVMAFQGRRELTVDGVVGPITWAALRTRLPTDDATSTMPVTDLVKEVPYLSQRDNRYDPNGTCNVTCLAMVLAARGEMPDAGRQLEDELFAELHSDQATAYYKANFAWAVNKGLNPNTVHGMLTWLARRHGLDASFRTDADLDDIFAELREDRPVILSGAFTGSGHLVLLVGRTCADDLIVHDPWGDWKLGYRGVPNGNRRIYPLDTVGHVLRGSGAGFWAHFFG